MLQEHSLPTDNCAVTWGHFPDIKVNLAKAPSAWSGHYFVLESNKMTFLLKNYTT